jgi:N-methylhydantoinase A/oxoprolinase/acetone carboxylase beta subunit
MDEKEQVVRICSFSFIMAAIPASGTGTVVPIDNIPTGSPGVLMPPCHGAAIAPECYKKNIKIPYKTSREFRQSAE